MALQITDTFTLEQSPIWVCPRCNQRTLEVKKDTFHSSPDSFSKKVIATDYYHQNDLTGGVFTTLLECVSSTCQEVVACSGTFSHEIDYPDDWQNEHETHYLNYKPKAFVPPLHAFPIPADCDETISEPLIGSFALLPCSPVAASNQLRVAVEKYLDAIGEPPAKTLGARIFALQGSDPAKFVLLDSLRLLGNSGSHEVGSVDDGDVMAGYMVIRKLLEDQYPEAKVDDSQKHALSLTGKFQKKP